MTTIRTSVKGSCELRDVGADVTNSCREENEIGRILNLGEWKEKCAWRSAVTWGEKVCHESERGKREKKKEY
jgi:hypothetical protein